MFGNNLKYIKIELEEKNEEIIKRMGKQSETKFNIKKGKIEREVSEIFSNETLN